MDTSSSAPLRLSIYTHTRSVAAICGQPVLLPNITRTCGITNIRPEGRDTFEETMSRRVCLNLARGHQCYYQEKDGTGRRLKEITVKNKSNDRKILVGWIDIHPAWEEALCVLTFPLFSACWFNGIRRPSQGYDRNNIIMPQGGFWHWEKFIKYLIWRLCIIYDINRPVIKEYRRYPLVVFFISCDITGKAQCGILLSGFDISPSKWRHFIQRMGTGGKWMRQIVMESMLDRCWRRSMTHGRRVNPIVTVWKWKNKMRRVQIYDNETTWSNANPIGFPLSSSWKVNSTVNVQWLRLPWKCWPFLFE